MDRAELINFLKVLEDKGWTVKQAIEYLEQGGRKKKIGRTKEKMVVETYEKRGGHPCT